MRSEHTFSLVQHWLNLAATHFSAFINPDFPVWRSKFFSFSLNTCFVQREVKLDLFRSTSVIRVCKQIACFNVFQQEKIMLHVGGQRISNAHVCMLRLPNATSANVSAHIYLHDLTHHDPSAEGLHNMLTCFFLPSVSASRIQVMHQRW